MTSTELRDLNFQQLQARISGMKTQVYDALLKHGPATTTELAERSGIWIFNLRPRVSDLLVLGLAECVGRKEGHGIYRGVPQAEWEAEQARTRALPKAEQMALL
jgi:hypothetical protein